MGDLAALRRFYARLVTATVGVTSPAIIDAFAAVPRERFLGSGPWQIPVLGGYNTRSIAADVGQTGSAFLRDGGSRSIVEPSLGIHGTPWDTRRRLQVAACGANCRGRFVARTAQAWSTERCASRHTTAGSCHDA